MASVQKETPLFPTSQVSGLWRFSGLLIVSYLGALNKNTLKDEWRRVNLSDLHLGLRPVCRVLIWMPLQHQLSITSAPSPGPVR